LIFPTIAFARPAGASTPHQVLIEYPGTPDSAIVGTSGNCAARFVVLTPRAFNLPAFTCRWVIASVANMICTWPAMRSVSACGPPL
jgi:hypothetical protein